MREIINIIGGEPAEIREGATQSTARTARLKLLRNARKALAGHNDLAWHQTGENAALSIIEQGFKTGSEMNTGERCGSIFFTKTVHRDVSYGRGEKRTIYLPAILSGMRMISNVDLGPMVKLSPENEMMVDKGIWTPEEASQYQIKLDIDEGVIPEGYDGVFMISHMDGHIRKFALSKAAANHGLFAALRLLGLPSPGSHT